MKYLFLLLISINCFAGAFAPLEKVGFDEKTYPKFHETKEQCEQAESSACYDIDACSLNVCELVDNYVLDYVTQRQYESCIDEADCDAKFSYLVCTEGEEIKNYETLSVYCAVNIMRVEGKKLAESPSKKAAYEAAKSSEASFQAGMNIARKAQACGKDTMAYMLVRNASKGLSNAQKKQLVKSFADIKGLLEVGSLDSAKEEISIAVADGVIITEADKTALNAYIDGCKP